MINASEIKPGQIFTVSRNRVTGDRSGIECIYKCIAVNEISIIGEVVKEDYYRKIGRKVIFQNDEHDFDLMPIEVVTDIKAI